MLRYVTYLDEGVLLAEETGKTGVKEVWRGLVARMEHDYECMIANSKVARG